MPVADLQEDDKREDHADDDCHLHGHECCAPVGRRLLAATVSPVLAEGLDRCRTAAHGITLDEDALDPDVAGRRLVPLG